MTGMLHQLIGWLPSTWRESIETESRDWVLRCPCGHENSVWELGGVRFKASGHPVRPACCLKCGGAFVARLQRRSESGDGDRGAEYATTYTAAAANTPGAARTAVRTAGESSAPRSSGRSLAAGCTLWIDGVGCWKLITADHAVVGAIGTGPDIPLQAPIARKQAVISRSGEGYWLTTDGAPPGVAEGAVGPSRLLRSGETFEIGGGVRLKLTVPNALSNTAVIELASSHRTQPRFDGVIMLDQACLLGPGSDAHIRCEHWSSTLVLFRRRGELWRQAAPGLQCDGDPANGDSPLRDGDVLSGEDLRLRLELSATG